MGENMGMCAVLAQASASPSVERAYIASISYFMARAEILRGELENVANVEVLPNPMLPMANYDHMTLRPCDLLTLNIGTDGDSPRILLTTDQHGRAALTLAHF